LRCFGGTLCDVSTSPAPNALSELDAAYAAGNFAQLRRIARHICAQPDADAQRVAQARAMADRVAVDPGALGMLAFSALLFCVIVLRYVLP
jgi:hypothetical protein